MMLDSKISRRLVLLAALFASGSASVMGNRVSAQAKTKTTVVALVDHTTNMVVKTKTGTITKQTFLAHPMVDGLPQFSQTVTVPANTMLTVTQSSPSSMQFKLPHSDQVLVAERPADVTYQSTGHPLGKAAVNQLARDGRRWAKGLTFDQRQAVTGYTSEGYEDMNAALRNPRTQTDVETMDMVQDLQSSLYKFRLRHPITVYRGTTRGGLKHALSNQKVSVGATYQDPAFSSTSVSPGIAHFFAGKVLLRINVPAGYHGAYIDSISDNQGEKEFLMDAGTPMVVTKLQKVRARTTQWFGVLHNHHLKHQKRQITRLFWLVTLALKQ